jgi:hypothetical protein
VGPANSFPHLVGPVLRLAVCGLMYLIAHAPCVVLSAHRKHIAVEKNAMEAGHKSLPVRIRRRSLMGLLFHFVMARAMFTLLFTAFLPIVDAEFPWVVWHRLTNVFPIDEVLKSKPYNGKLSNMETPEWACYPQSKGIGARNASVLAFHL